MATVNLIGAVSLLRYNCLKSAISWEYLRFHLYRTRKDSLKLNRTSLRQAQGSAKERAILYALDSTKYNKAKAADLLGIHRSLLYKKIKKYDLPLKKGGFPYIQPETPKKKKNNFTYGAGILLL